MSLLISKDESWVGEAFRSEILENSGLANLIDYDDELNRFAFFINRLEQFVSESETTGVKTLSLNLGALTDEQKSDFWMWNYPIHWEDIFGSRIRVGFCIHLCSHVETLLADIAHRIQVIERQKLGLKNSVECLRENEQDCT